MLVSITKGFSDGFPLKAEGWVGKIFTEVGSSKEIKMMEPRCNRIQKVILHHPNPGGCKFGERSSQSLDPLEFMQVITRTWLP